MIAANDEARVMHTGRHRPLPEAADPPLRPLITFWQPRYWHVWCFWLWLRMSAALPLGVALALHRGVGRIIYRTSARQRRIVRRNIELCFPDLPPQERERLVRRHFESLGMSLAESAFAWFAADRRFDGRFEIIGLEHLKRALDLGKGVILYTGHFTTLEICGRPLRHVTPRFACMFSHRSNALMDEIQLRGRMRIAHETIPSDHVRSMIRSLQRNSVVWYAPDRIHRDGKLIPFFRELAVTNVATSKLTRVSGAVVLPFTYRRCGDTGRYELRVHAPLEDFPTEDALADTRRLGEHLESFIRRSPEQYQWTHRRFKNRPAPLPDLYRA